MKKILCLLLIAASLLGIASCAKYDPVKSTEEEKAVVMTMIFGEEEYEVKYELYRALFLNHKSEVDGGDESVWSGESRTEYIEKINKLIINDASEIFAAFYVAKVGAGFDVFSGKADKLVEQYVEDSVDGSEDGIGYESYEKYLQHLKSINLNYSVQELMIRYYIALDKIGEFYGGKEDDSSTEENEAKDPMYDASLSEVREFYYSNSFARILYAYFSEGIWQEGDKRPDGTPIENPVPKVHAAMVAAAEDGDIVGLKTALYSSATSPDEIEVGIFMPASSFNNELYDRITSAAFSLSAGEVSEIINISSTGEANIDGDYILYSMEKSEDDFERYYNQVRIAYIDELIGRLLNAHAVTISGSVSYEDKYSSVVHSEISM